MVDALANSTNIKHRNCKFLKFLNKLNHGAYTIENDNLVKHSEKIKEFREIDTARRNAEKLEESKQQHEEFNEEKFTNILEGN
jgi:hypothetical protein